MIKITLSFLFSLTLTAALWGQTTALVDPSQVGRYTLGTDQMVISGEGIACDACGETVRNLSLVSSDPVSRELRGEWSVNGKFKPVRIRIFWEERMQAHLMVVTDAQSGTILRRGMQVLSSGSRDNTTGRLTSPEDPVAAPRDPKKK